MDYFRVLLSFLIFLDLSTVYIRYYEVKGGADGYKVGYHVALAADVHNSDKIEARTLEVNTVWILLTVALDVDTESASACFHLLIPAAGGELDDFGHLGAYRAFGNTINKLCENAYAFFYLSHAHHVTCV